MILTVPKIDEVFFPTLGPQVAAWIETNLVHGPGDLRGRPAKLDGEKRMLLYRIYEVWPPGHPQAGRRRFKRVALMLRKGSAKTEFAAWIAAAELHPTAPVRCSGFDERGEPIGVGVIDPYIPMVAYTEEQSEDLAYGALRVILEHSAVADDFDIGLERVMRVGGDGKAVPLASAPNSRDGARTTFQHYDETHRFTLDRLKKAHQAMERNIPKRKLADGWSFETTTAFSPGEHSVAEETYAYGRAIDEGRVADPRLFFFYRWAGDEHDISTQEGVKAAVLDASGEMAAWSDIDSICAQFDDPQADRSYLERTWLNRIVKGSDKAFDATRWAELARGEQLVADGALITLGFDGARYLDATSIVATEILTGFQFPIKTWEKDPLNAEWEVPVDEVLAAMAEAFRRFKVWRLYGDPPYWEETFAKWSGEYGEERVVAWPTNKWLKMADAVRSFANAIASGELTHSGEKTLARHVANAYRKLLLSRDSEGKPLWVIQKERSDSPLKIDAAVAAVLSWQARRDALAAGVGKKKRSRYDDGAELTVLSVNDDDPAPEEANP